MLRGAEYPTHLLRQYLDANEDSNYYHGWYCLLQCFYRDNDFVANDQSLLSLEVAGWLGGKIHGKQRSVR